MIPEAAEFKDFVEIMAGVEEITERWDCRPDITPEHAEQLEKAGIKVTWIPTMTNTQQPDKACPRCKGTCKVKSADGKQDVKCPNCAGSGKAPYWKKSHANNQSQSPEAGQETPEGNSPAA